MPEGKVVLVNLMKGERAPIRAGEAQSAASGPRSETPSRCPVRVGDFARQDSMACSKVS